MCLAGRRIEASPTFAMFALSSGIKLGLWSRDEVAPAADGAVGSAELALTLPDAEAVRAAHCRKLKIAQPPTAIDFGLTFVALDPDGHPPRTACAMTPHPTGAADTARPPRVSGGQRRKMQ
jgi:hypothetical protein